jgi:hypothetical protein
VNLRPFANVSIVGNVFAPLFVIAKGVSDDVTVAELSQKLRNDFTKKIERKAFLDSLKMSVSGYQTLSKPAAFIDVSNVGNFEIRAPIVDLWLQQTMKSREIEDSLSLLSFSVTGGKGAKVIVRWQSSPTVFNRADSARAFKAVLHSLRYLRPSTKVGDALRELREVVIP